MFKYPFIFIICLLAGCASAPTPTAAPVSEAAVTVTPIIGDTTPVVPVGTLSSPFDALFIDTMTALHTNAVTLAQSGVDDSEHEELRTFAQGIIDTQGAQIEQMNEWRTAWYADLQPSTTLLTNVTNVQIPENSEVPFDFRFINAVIDHHRVSIAIAQLAQSQAEHPELRTLAEEIVADYTAAITQLEAWRQTWFDVSG